jgi:hypothetical protein
MLNYQQKLKNNRAGAHKMNRKISEVADKKSRRQQNANSDVG